MRKYFFIIFFLFFFILNLSVVSQAQKIVSYSSGDNYKNSQSDFSENYSCNLDELENVSTELFKQRKITELATVYDKCIAAYTDKAYLYNNRANVYKMLKKYELALTDYEKAIALDENYINPQLGKATTLIITSKLDETLDILNVITKNEPKEPRAYYNKGLVYSFKKDRKKALKNYNLAVKYAKYPLPNAYFERGNLHAFYKENFKKALSDYTKAINSSEFSENIDIINLNSLAEIYHNRALVYYKLKKENMMLNDMVKAMILYEKEGNISLAEEIRDNFLQDYLLRWIIFDEETHIEKKSLQAFNTELEDDKDEFYIYYVKDFKSPSNYILFHEAEKILKSEISYFSRCIIINATQKKSANKAVWFINTNGKLIKEKIYNDDKLIWNEYTSESKIAKILECIIEELNNQPQI